MHSCWEGAGCDNKIDETESCLSSGMDLWQYKGQPMLTPLCSFSAVVRLSVSSISSDFCSRELSDSGPRCNSLVKLSGLVDTICLECLSPCFTVRRMIIPCSLYTEYFTIPNAFSLSYLILIAS